MMIKRKKALVLPAVGVFCLAASIAQPVAVMAQDDDEVVTFEEDDVIEGNPENAERMANFLRIADNSIMDYVNEATDSIQQGHRQGFSDFRTWYRQRRAEQARGEATQQMVASVCGSLLGAGLNFVFPGSGVFITLLKSGLEGAYGAVTSQISTVSEGDTNSFLDAHERALEGVITAFEDMPDEFRRNGGEDFEAAKWEFVWEAMDRDETGERDSTEVGPRTRRLLERMGIPRPGSETANRFRARVLTRQIYAVFSQDRNLRTSWGENDMRNGASTSALRHIYPGQPDRYCPDETALNNFFWTPECREWHARAFPR